ncbi:MAG: hypothetical protein Q8O46_05580 [bacterium]|nr:hypothetical protein [bacterium]
MSVNPFEGLGPLSSKMKGSEGELQARLYVGGWGNFLGTFPGDESGELEARKFAKLYGGIVKSFGIEIQKIDPTNNEVKEWKEEKNGYSVWKM